MRFSWQAWAGIGLIGVYSLVMMATGGAAPYAWAILGAAFVLLVAGARGVARSRQVRGD